MNNKNTFHSSEEILHEFANIIHKISGITFPLSHMRVLDQRIQTTIKEKKCTDTDLLKLLKQDPKELHIFIGHITTNHTHFFRSNEQFNVLGSTILPELIEKNKFSKNIMIWSAACSSGEEPYTISLYLTNYFKKNGLNDWTFRILASDIDESSLEIAEKGEYPIHAIKYIPEEYRHLIKIEDNPNKFIQDRILKIPAEIRQYITFKQHNLLHPAYASNLDIIFCRNVLIYFDEQTQKKVVENLLSALNHNRYLYISPSETLIDINTSLKPQILSKCVYYTNS